jgi:hypothetical protein
MTPDDGNALTSLDDTAEALASLADSEGTPEATTEEQVEEEASEKSEDTEEEAEDQDQSEPAEKEPDVENIEVTLKDGTKTTVHELARSFYREADYTRDKQAHAQEKREFHDNYVPLAGEKIRRLDALAETFETMIGKEPDPDQDPIGYADWAKKGKLLSIARQERDNLRQTQFAQMRQSALQELASGRVFDDWKDADTLNKGLNALQEYALAEGFRPEELSTLADQRLYKLLEKSRRYDAGQQAKTKLVKAVGVKAAMKPGVKSAQSGLKQQGVMQAEKKFAKSLSTNDALDYLTRLAS